MSTQVLSIHINIVHSPATDELIANTESELRSVREAAEDTAQEVKRLINEIDPSRACTIVFGVKEGTAEDVFSGSLS